MRFISLPLGEVAEEPNEGRTCHVNPVMGNHGKAAPHQSASRTASPEGEAIFFLIHDRGLYLIRRIGPGQRPGQGPG